MSVKRNKSAFQQRSSKAHKLRDLDKTFNRLNATAELVVKENFGLLIYNFRISLNQQEINCFKVIRSTT